MSQSLHILYSINELKRFA